MNKSLLASIFCILSITIFANTERNLLAKSQTAESISQCVLLNQKWVPYPHYSERAAWDKLLGHNKQLLVKRGEKQLNYEWKVIKATDYLEYERSGDRNIMQDPNSANINALSGLVMAELAEGKGRFLDQIINGVFYECERTSWALSAHLPVQHSRRNLPEINDQIIDLGSGEMGAFLSWTYYFFHSEFDKVNPEISKRIQSEVYNKIILPYRNVDRFWWMAFQPKPDQVVNNWNPWCNFNVLQCMLLLENDPQQLNKDIYRTMLSVDKFINYVNADGACEEGPSYWEHAAGKLYDYLQLLYLATNGKISLFDNSMVKNMGEYISRSYVGNNWVVNFADASAHFSTNANLIYRYGKSINSQEMMHFAAYLAKGADNTLTYGSDIFRVLQSVYFDAELKNITPEHKASEVTIYPETQFFYLKNDNQFYVAIKGGHNAESHNHNDVGTFSLWFEQTPIIIDAGVGTYTRQTFGPERYSIWTMRSLYHNLPVINGVEQHDGREFHATNVLTNLKTKTVSFNIASAYPSASESKNWTRTYQLAANKLIINDKFQLNKTITANEVNFMLWGKVDLTTPGRVLIEVNSKKMELIYDANQFIASIETIPLPDTRLSNVWGKEIYRLTLKAKKLTLNDNYQFVIQKHKQ
jgi:hypothetical protein